MALPDCDTAHSLLCNISVQIFSTRTSKFANMPTSKSRAAKAELGEIREKNFS